MRSDMWLSRTAPCLKGGIFWADIILQMKNITKEFPGVKALSNVNLTVERGEIDALIGENGAGKSTLMNVLSDTYPVGTYTGEIYYNGKLCEFKTLKDSEAEGTVIIHQELALIPLLTIGENMFLGNEIKTSRGTLDWDRMFHEAEAHMEQVGLHESAQTLIKDIGTGKQQLIEIAKALSKNVKLLILDEPTSSLNDEDAKMLLDLLMAFKKEGLTSIIITHKLNEIIYCADKATIIRDGATIETLVKGVDDLSEDRIIKGQNSAFSDFSKTIVIAAVLLFYCFKLANYKGISVMLLWVAAICLIYNFITSKTAFGRYFYAVGGNEKATKLSGINTDKVYFLAYANMGLLAGLCGLLCLARVGSVNGSTGTSFEMDAIGSCFIGGASAYGGSGTIPGVIIGALLLGIINMGMSILGIGDSWQYVVKGAVLLIAVIFSVVFKKGSN